MEQEMINKVKAVAEAPSCCDELREVAKEWLDAVGTDREKEMGKKLIAELEEDVCTIDQVIALFDSEEGREMFGKETAASLLAHAKEVKAKGGEWCDCPACTPGRSILDHKELL